MNRPALPAFPLLFSLELFEGLCSILSLVDQWKSGSCKAQPSSRDATKYFCLSDDLGQQ